MSVGEVDAIGSDEVLDSDSTMVDARPEMSVESMVVDSAVEEVTADVEDSTGVAALPARLANPTAGWKGCTGRGQPRDNLTRQGYSPR